MVDNAYYADLENELTLALRELEPVTTLSERDEVMMFVGHGEYGVAFETLMAILADKKAQASARATDMLQHLAAKLDMKELV